jgi:3-phosphoshikimate 1-carboxyvinyltransferase
MKYIITKTEKLSGVCLMPGSKSETIRALILAALSIGKSEIENFLDCEDTQTALKVLKNLNVLVRRQSGKLTLESTGLPVKIKSKNINTGNSGITTRFILPVLGLRENSTDPIMFDCGRQMRKRPIASLVHSLNDLGMNIKFLKTKGICPLLVKGRLTGGVSQVDGITSQYISGLLLSLPLAEKNSIITIKNLHERPYVKMTLAYLKERGISVSHRNIKNEDIFKIRGRQEYKGLNKKIPGDFSSASCFIAAGCLIKGQTVLEGLDMKSLQGDKKLVEILGRMGADIRILKNKIIIHGGKKLTGVEIDANDIPDLVPALAVVGTAAEGKTTIYNVPQARLKETDRIKSMSLGLRRMGAKLEEHKDGLTIYKSDLKGCTVSGYRDHRTVMAFAVAGMVAAGTTVVNDAEAVNKTFPKFYQLIKSLGANIKLKK